jgi:hypothetical protein
MQLFGQSLNLIFVFLNGMFEFVFGFLFELLLGFGKGFDLVSIVMLDLVLDLDLMFDIVHEELDLLFLLGNLFIIVINSFLLVTSLLRYILLLFFKNSHLGFEILHLLVRGFI